MRSLRAAGKAHRDAGSAAVFPAVVAERGAFRRPAALGCS